MFILTTLVRVWSKSKNRLLFKSMWCSEFLLNDAKHKHVSEAEEGVPAEKNQ